MFASDRRDLGVCPTAAVLLLSARAWTVTSVVQLRRTDVGMSAKSKPTSEMRAHYQRRLFYAGTVGLLIMYASAIILLILSFGGCGIRAGSQGVPWHLKDLLVYVEQSEHAPGRLRLAADLACRRDTSR
jgi:hypothetical protein